MDPSTGERKTGWISVDGEKYYLNTSTGVLAVNQWIDDDNYVGENGVLIPGYNNNISFHLLSAIQRPTLHPISHNNEHCFS